MRRPEEKEAAAGAAHSRDSDRPFHGDSDHHFRGEPITGRSEAARASDCEPW